MGVVDMDQDAAAIAAIVKGLTQDERSALLAATECKGGRWWTAYSSAFYRKTDLQQSGVLTPLGLAVRDHLLKCPD